MATASKALHRSRTRRKHESRERTIKACAEALQELIVGIAGHTEPSLFFGSLTIRAIVDMARSAVDANCEVSLARLECNDRIMLGMEGVATRAFDVQERCLDILEDLATVPNLSPEERATIQDGINEISLRAVQVYLTHTEVGVATIKENEVIDTSHRASNNRTLVKTAAGILLIVGASGLWWWSGGLSTPATVKMAAAGAAMV